MIIKKTLEKKTSGFTPLEKSTLRRDYFKATVQGQKPSSFLTGFTLIEMLIVIFIIGIFSSLVVINLRQGLVTDEINNQTLLFLDYLERAQSMALAGVMVDGLVPVSYGIITGNQINFVGRLNYSGCANGCLFADTINGLVYLEEIKWSEGLSLDRGIVDQWRVSFELPRAKTAISLDGNLSNLLVFKLKNEQDNLSKCIEISGISGRFGVVNCL